MIIALGVVFGDIGTSPLYALRECFSGTHAMPLEAVNVAGAVSLIFWALLLVVCIKYITIVMRADNKGEGGILALMTLASKIKPNSNGKYHAFVMIAGILGASLLFSDGMITPAISVLSAVEGLNVATSAFKDWIIPISIAVIVALFLFQSHGTAKVGTLFGPILLVWFSVMGLLGLNAIIKSPEILQALSPINAIRFFFHNGMQSFMVLGSVFLALTGAEVLYADLGHFGIRPIRQAWFFIVFPSLILNYLGQGAFLLTHLNHGSVENLFYRLSPTWALYPLVILATIATIIASQAVISGMFSLARQSVQLGLWPRLFIRHTSTETAGQVYVPFINWTLMLGVAFLILFFKHSGNLASAYGIAVSTDMIITTSLIILIARYQWNINKYLLIAMAVFLLMIDISFFCANIVKIKAGGWIVLVIAISLFTLIRTWMKGRIVLRNSIVERSMDLATFTKTIATESITRVKGIAVFLASNTSTVPGALLHNLKHNKVLHETTLMLSVTTEDIPVVAESARYSFVSYGHGIHAAIVRYGFSEIPNIPAILNKLNIPDLKFTEMNTTYFLGRETLVVVNNNRMASWRKRLFWFLSNNALNPSLYYQLPPNRVVELGTRSEL